jgi:hypothetical protein
MSYLAGMDTEQKQRRAQFARWVERHNLLTVRGVPDYDRIGAAWGFTGRQIYRLWNGDTPLTLQHVTLMLANDLLAGHNSEVQSELAMLERDMKRNMKQSGAEPFWN